MKRKLHDRGIMDPHEEDVFDFGLFLLENILSQNGISLCNYPSMPCPITDWDALDKNPYLSEQYAYEPCHKESLALNHICLLNSDQLSAFNSCLLSVSSNLGKLFFLNGPAGTGKMFVYKALCHCVRASGWIALCVASSGIAALLLPGGRTAHSTFAIPVQGLAENTSCDIDKALKQADMLHHIQLIIWDEAAMQHQFVSLLFFFHLQLESFFPCSDMQLKVLIALSMTFDPWIHPLVESLSSSGATFNKLFLLS
jgi:hypothetical protein